MAPGQRRHMFPPLPTPTHLGLQPLRETLLRGGGRDTVDRRRAAVQPATDKPAICIK